MKLNLLLNLLLLCTFFHWKVKKNQNIPKELHFGAPGRVLTYLLSLNIRVTSMYGFYYYCTFRYF